MSLEHSPSRSSHATLAGSGPSPDSGSADDLDYWHGLIDTDAAAAFLDLATETMRRLRTRGTGPRFIRLTSQLARYRRIDLKEFADARLCRSTRDPGPKAAA